MRRRLLVAVVTVLGVPVLLSVLLLLAIATGLVGHEILHGPPRPHRRYLLPPTGSAGCVEFEFEAADAGPFPRQDGFQVVDLRQVNGRIRTSDPFSSDPDHGFDEHLVEADGGWLQVDLPEVRPWTRDGGNGSTVDVLCFGRHEVTPFRRYLLPRDFEGCVQMTFEAADAGPLPRDDGVGFQLVDLRSRPEQLRTSDAYWPEGNAYLEEFLLAELDGGWTEVEDPMLDYTLQDGESVPDVRVLCFGGAQPER